MDGARTQRRVLKRLLVAVVVIVALPVVAIIASGVALRSGAVGRIVAPYLSELVDSSACISFSRLDGTVLHLPKLTVNVRDLSVTYPHGRYACPDTSSFGQEGRGECVDTLAYVASMRLSVNLLEVMHGTIGVSSLEVKGIRAFLYQFDSLRANWDIFPSSDEPEDTVCKPLSLPDIKLKHVRIGGGDSHVVFGSRPSALVACVDPMTISIDRKRRLMYTEANLEVGLSYGDNHRLRSPVAFEGLVALKTGRKGVAIAVKDLHADLLDIPVELSGIAGLHGTHTDLDMNVNVPNCPLGELFSKYGPLFFEDALKVSTDAALSIELSTKGKLCKTEGLFPRTDVSISVPESSFAYRGVLENGSLGLKASASMMPDKFVSAEVRDLRICGPGFNLTASGKASDILGEAFKFSIGLDSDIRLRSLMTLVLGDKSSGFEADGTFDMTLKANDVTRSHLSESGFMDADFNLRISGDSLSLDVAENDLSARLLSPEISVRTMQSLVEKDRNALAVRIGADSLDVISGNQFIRGKNVLVLAQDASSSITDYNVIPPLKAMLKADMFAMKGVDSMLVAVLGTSNELTVKPVVEDGKTVPDIRIQSNVERMLYLSTLDRASLSGVYVSAGARKVVPRERKFTRREGRQRIRELDTFNAPLSFSLSESVQKVMSEWNPVGRLRLSGGVLLTGRLPLKNSIRDVDVDFNVNRASINNATVLSGNSDITLSASLDGIRKAVTGRGRDRMDFSAKITSTSLDLDEIIGALHASTDSSMPEIADVETTEDFEAALSDTTFSAQSDTVSSRVPLILVPGNVSADIQISSDRMRFAGLDFHGLHAGAAIRDNTLLFNDLHASSDVGSARLNAFYSTAPGDDIRMGYDLSLSDITADRVIALIPRVGETVPVIRSFKGVLDFDLAATCRLDSCMNIVVPSIDGLASISGKDLLIEDFGSLRKVARLLMFKDKNSGHIDDLSIKAIISDSKLEVFPFILSVDRYKLALTGMQNFQQDYACHVSLVKSPLPFILGLKVFGNSYRDVKVKLESPQFRTTTLPLFDNQIDEMHLNLVTSIREVLHRGVEAAVEQNARSRKAVLSRREEYSYDEHSAIMSSEDYRKYDLEMIKMEVEEEAESLDNEINQLLANL